MLFEMLTGLPPFYDSNVSKMYRKILNDDIEFPSFMSPEICDFISKLLDRDPQTRLGASERDVEELKEHPFFYGMLYLKREFNLNGFLKLALLRMFRTLMKISPFKEKVHPYTMQLVSQIKFKPLLLALHQLKTMVCNSLLSKTFGLVIIKQL